MISIKGDVDRWDCVYKECKARCCKPAKVTIGDLRRISDKLSIPVKEFAETEDERGIFSLKDKKSSCFFLNDDYSCVLHKEKVVPLSCKMFPFLLDGITYSDDIILSVKPASDCPGYGRGKKLGNEFKSELETLSSQLVHEINQYLKGKQQGQSFSEIFKTFR